MPAAAVVGAVAQRLREERRKKNKLREMAKQNSNVTLDTNATADTFGSRREGEDRKRRERLSSKYMNPELYDNPSIVQYIKIARVCESITFSDRFNAFIIFVITLAGFIVGMQTYPDLADDPIVVAADNGILIIFSIEVVFKIVAEGLGPWKYFTGAEWRWNIFDFIIVVLCMPMWGDTFGGGSVALLRLIRLMRLMKLVKKVPQLQMIVMGLIGGMKSIGYIMALLFLVFYLYAVFGIYTFKDNDPFHFGDLFTAMHTLFRISTLEDWTDVLYINYYGCESDFYSNGIYVQNDIGKTEGNGFIWCTDGKVAPNGYVAIVYFVTFVIIAALVMLSLFVGAVTMSMTESMEQMKMEAEEAEKRRRLLKAKRRAEEQQRREKEEAEQATANVDSETDGIVLKSKQKKRRDKQAVFKGVAKRAVTHLKRPSMMLRNFSKNDVLDELRKRQRKEQDEEVMSEPESSTAYQKPQPLDPRKRSASHFDLHLDISSGSESEIVSLEPDETSDEEEEKNEPQRLETKDDTTNSQNKESLSDEEKKSDKMLEKSQSRVSSSKSAMISRQHTTKMSTSESFRRNSDPNSNDYANTRYTGRSVEEILRDSTKRPSSPKLARINGLSAGSAKLHLSTNGFSFKEPILDPQQTSQEIESSNSINRKDSRARENVVLQVRAGRKHSLITAGNSSDTVATEKIGQDKFEEPPPVPASPTNAENKSRGSSILRKISQGRGSSNFAFTPKGVRINVFSNWSNRRSIFEEGKNLYPFQSPKYSDDKKKSELWDDNMTRHRIRHLMANAWEGVDLLDLIDDVEEETLHRHPWKKVWLILSRMCQYLTEDPRFANFITVVIILAGIQVGAQTFDNLNVNEGKVVLQTIDDIILGIFTLEVVCKTVAKEFKPWQYFYDHREGFQGWNTFDYFVVAGSFIPGSGSMLTMLRLLRILRVLKLVKSLPELQIIVVALIGGISSISYIGVIMFLVLYVFAILGMLLFQENDPWHFGSLHISLFTLFRCATLEDWSDVMYINIYGCNMYGYTELENLCVHPTALYTAAAMYFVVFTVIAALVLMTLFIGVVTTSMEEATATQQQQLELNARVKEVQEQEGLDDKTIRQYEQVFKVLDLDGGGTIEEEELRIGLQTIGKIPNEDHLRVMLKAVDEDDSGEIDIAEFVMFMCMLKNEDRRKREKADLVRRNVHANLMLGLKRIHGRTSRFLFGNNQMKIAPDDLDSPQEERPSDGMHLSPLDSRIVPNVTMIQPAPCSGLSSSKYRASISGPK